MLDRLLITLLMRFCPSKITLATSAIRFEIANISSHYLSDSYSYIP